MREDKGVGDADGEKEKDGQENRRRYSVGHDAAPAIGLWHAGALLSVSVACMRW